MRYLALVLILLSTLAVALYNDAPTSTPVSVAQSADDAGVPDGGVSTERAKQVLHIRFVTSVDESSANSVIRVLEEQADKVDVAVIEINSPGGMTDPAFDMVKAIESFPKPVVCVVDGQGASSAFYILQGCDQRLMTSRSTLMAHEPLFILQAEKRLTRKELWNLSQEQNALALAWTAHAGAKLNMSLEDFRKKIKWNDWNMASAEALKVGAVDEVVPSVKFVLDREAE